MHHAVRNSYLTALHLDGDADAVFCIDVGIERGVVAVDAVLAAVSGVPDGQCKAVHARVVLGQALQQAGRDRIAAHDIVRRFRVQQDGQFGFRVDALEQLDAGVNHIFISRNKRFGFGQRVHRRSNDRRIRSVRNGCFTVDPALDVTGVERTLEHRELVNCTVEELALGPIVLLKRPQDQRFVHRAAVIGDADIGVIAHVGVRFGGHLAAIDRDGDSNFVPVEIAQIDKWAIRPVKIEAEVAVVPNGTDQTMESAVLGGAAQQAERACRCGQTVALNLHQDGPRGLRADSLKQLDSGIDVLFVRRRESLGRCQLVHRRRQGHAGCRDRHRTRSRLSARCSRDRAAARLDGLDHAAGNRRITAGRDRPCHGLVGGVAGQDCGRQRLAAALGQAQGGFVERHTGHRDCCHHRCRRDGHTSGHAGNAHHPGAGVVGAGRNVCAAHLDGHAGQGVAGCRRQGGRKRAALRHAGRARGAGHMAQTVGDAVIGRRRRGRVPATLPKLRLEGVQLALHGAVTVCRRLKQRQDQRFGGVGKARASGAGGSCSASIAFGALWPRCTLRTGSSVFARRTLCTSIAFEALWPRCALRTGCAGCTARKHEIQLAVYNGRAGRVPAGHCADGEVCGGGTAARAAAAAAVFCQRFERSGHALARFVGQDRGCDLCHFG